MQITNKSWIQLMQSSQLLKCISMNQFQKIVNVKFYIRGQNVYSNDLYVQQ